MSKFDAVIKFKDAKTERKVAGVLSLCGTERIDAEAARELPGRKTLVFSDDIDLIHDHPWLAGALNRILFLGEEEFNAKELDPHITDFNHVVATSGAVTSHYRPDRIIAINNAVRGGGFDLLHHLGPATTRSFQLCFSKQRDWFRQELKTYFASIAPTLPRAMPSAVQFATDIQDELLMNAVWDAHPERIKQSRRDAVVLNPAETIHVKWAFDGLRFGISVKDFAGTFPPGLYRKYLSDAFPNVKRPKITVNSSTTDSAGAGVGLHMVLQRSSAMTINLSPGKFTEVIVILNLAPTSKHVADTTSAPKNFHCFNLGGLTAA